MYLQYQEIHHLIIRISFFEGEEVINEKNLIGIGGNLPNFSRGNFNNKGRERRYRGQPSAGKEIIQDKWMLDIVSNRINLNFTE
jgi:hypothetical protein